MILILFNFIDVYQFPVNQHSFSNVLENLKIIKLTEYFPTLPDLLRISIWNEARLRQLEWKGPFK